MRLRLELSLPTSVAPSPRVMQVASMFGLGVESRQLSILPPTELDLRPGQLVFITGPSGSGKSSLLRLIAEAAPDHGVHVLRFESLRALPEKPLVDALDAPLDVLLSTLARAGLSDAFVLLRKPSELSDGQRYRLRLAQAMLAVRDVPDDQPVLLLADEFGATLDRLTAAVIARNLRKWTRRGDGRRVCFICATTHDDLLEPLEPDVLIEKHLGPSVEVVSR